LPTTGYWRRDGNFDLAVQDITKAIELKKDYAGPYHNLGIIYATRGGQGDFDQAIRNFDKAIFLNDSDVQVYFERAQVYEKRGDEKKKDSDSAIADYRLAFLYTKDSQAPKLRQIAEQATQSLMRLGSSPDFQPIAAKPRIALYFIDSQDSKIQFTILNALASRKYDARIGDPNPLADTNGEVRFFYDEDQKNAYIIMKIIQDSLNQANAKDASGSKITMHLTAGQAWAQRARKTIAPGTIEVWIPPLFSPPPVEQNPATQSGSPPQTVPMQKSRKAIKRD
jgi:tetratricopeptide (TPR) repeat protein